MVFELSLTHCDTASLFVSLVVSCISYTTETYYWYVSESLIEDEETMRHDTKHFTFWCIISTELLRPVDEKWSLLLCCVCLHSEAIFRHVHEIIWELSAEFLISLPFIHSQVLFSDVFTTTTNSGFRQDHSSYHNILSWHLRWYLLPVWYCLSIFCICRH